jgi:hypothetical protein
MRASTTIVPIHHSQVSYQVRTSRSSERDLRGRPVAAPAPRSRPRRTSSNQYTLLELVEAIADVTDDEREIVATVLHLLASGQVRLCGNFRDEPVERILAS